MTRVPFTADVLTWIKNGATAHELGWDESFYLSVCRKHGLQPIVYAPKTQTPPEIAVTPPISPKPVTAPKPDDKRKRPIGKLRLSESTAVPREMRDAMVKAAERARISQSLFITRALEAAEASEGFPDWRNGSSAALTINPTFTDAELRHYTALAKSRHWNLAELVRRALQFALSKQPSNLSAKPLPDTAVKAGLPR